LYLKLLEYVLVCASDLDPLPILTHYTGHSSLAYGADWCRITSSSQSLASSVGNIATPHETGLDAAQVLSEKTNPDRTIEKSGSLDTAQHVLIASCSFYDHSLQLWRAQV
jgi:hypothetical protein